jgi:Protein of unknown function (DUF2911)
MMRWLSLCALILSSIVLSSTAVAQDSSSLPGFAYCTYTDQKQISVRYAEPSIKKESIQDGKLWMPGGTKMDLFTETPLMLGTTQIPIGAYAMYFVPGKDSWMLVVNKNVTAGAPYNQSQDLVRLPMPTEKLDEPQNQLSLYFGHIAPKQCTLRVDYGKTRATVSINEE